MENQIVDINVDVGEGIGNEPQIMPYIASCNIACGGHAGDVETMTSVVKLAKKHRVKIGAHPSFPDKKNFGRQAMDMSCVALFTSVKQQINSLVSILNEQHAIFHHVKPHGALYNLAATDERIAKVLVEVMKSIVLPIKLYVPYKSVIADLAQQNGINITYEAFADRNYNDNLTLVSRQEKDALIDDENELFEHVFRMISKGKVKTIQGHEIGIKANTFCIHGDHPKAVILIKNLKEKLELHGIKIR
ncbi:5-oxoprolinase subunit PxpA [Flaviramulus sp. BrNp1-15]|uniref:5-oxoprolinase subunit PxpA n=1 Tax=Flaviramulus sp. BrNp1-15 TaxID=2916754 RepID=UPI001EE7F389|nr:5-oxoprolinase subunit PxpA [Flaviramulus sp. BrNp1-15]ULC58475.1 5-oxoprolinase subunit PxpA [Flaviramulus sp. BrNp1-15]